MQHSGFTTIDAVIALVYVLSIIGIGVYLYNKQKSTKDFLLAGRSMGWFSIGLTLMATLTSAVGYMAYPAGAFKYGLIMLWMAMAIPISYPLVVYVFMPFYHRLRVYTAYEYLERRFNTNVRALASAIFILWRLTWMAAVVYVPSMVLNVVTNGKIPLIPSILILGIITTITTALGGMKATMWSNVIHSFVMFAGMILAVILIFTSVPGGFSEVWSTLLAAGKTSMTAKIPGFENAGFFGQIKLYLVTDITVVSLIITYSVQKMGNYCVDQAMVQSYLTAKSLSESRKGFFTNAVAYLLYILLVTFIGAGLFAVASHLNFPKGLGIDKIFPYFIANVMPVGVTGLMIAAIYGASMSSLNSGINSSIAAILNDFYGRYILKVYNLEEGEVSVEENARRLKIARYSTLVLGAIITVGACFVGQMGNIFIYSQKLINMFTGPLFGVFVLAMFSKRANPTGALVAGFIGFVIGSVLVFAKRWGIDSLAVGVLWPAALSFFATLVLGYGLSLIIGKNSEGALEYTWRKVMKNYSLQDESADEA